MEALLVHPLVYGQRDYRKLRGNIGISLYALRRQSRTACMVVCVKHSCIDLPWLDFEIIMLNSLST
ncbi:hypothetical protein KIN20_014657 [Parelaphostrongylus tenuis]|uniref:Uncharacterized protein n=1 Tax=Parelaphostrongylus tenuis TaxID=148309 RepID=A0AAD5MHG2_PARTN|nr:hypothetical protein KIN20_014657 [Parelaphostrongylus tenuis]